MTPTHDNATAVDLSAASVEYLAFALNVRHEREAAAVITALQARVAEVEAELAFHRVLLVSATERSELFEDERDAALSREKEAKAEAERIADDYHWDSPYQCAGAMDEMRGAIAALAETLTQSSGADAGGEDRG